MPADCLVTDRRQVMSLLSVVSYLTEKGRGPMSIMHYAFSIQTFCTIAPQN